MKKSASKHFNYLHANIRAKSGRKYLKYLIAAVIKKQGECYVRTLFYEGENKITRRECGPNYLYCGRAKWCFVFISVRAEYVLISRE